MVQTLVSGEIQFPENTPHFGKATVFVKLMDTGIMDGQLKVVSEMTMPFADYTGYPIAYMLEGDDVGNRNNLSVHVHISLNGSDSIDKGDYITKQRYNLGDKKELNVKVEKI